MESVKKVLDKLWNENPEMHHSKHCTYQGRKIEEVNNLYENEIIYLVVHGTIFPGLPGWKANGLAITNLGIHFDTLKDVFFISFNVP